MTFLGQTRGILLALIVIITHSYLFKQKVDIAFHAATDITINVRVNTFFKQIPSGNEYLVRLESINGRKIPYFYRPNVKLITPSEYQWALGERWKLAATIRPIYGRLNEAGFDLERYFISQGIHARAKINLDQPPQLIAATRSLRLATYQIVTNYIRDLPNASLMYALTFGDRNHLSPEQWNRLKTSGLIHLIAISGLHIGIAYILGWKLGHLVRILAPKWFIAPYAFAVLFSCGYAWMAGFSIPTVRALIMCTLLGFFYVNRSGFSQWRILLLTMSIMLAIDPFSSISTSFWLTFTAIAVIYIITSIKSYAEASRLYQLLIMQLAMTVLMLPATVFFFSGFSVSSLVYNLIFISWFSLVVVPTLFLALFLSIAGLFDVQWLWNLIDALLSPVFWSIQFSTLSWVSIGNKGALITLIVLLYILFTPFLSRIIRFGYGTALLSLSVITLNTDQSEKSWRVKVLDVGHGLALLVEKNGQHLLYDTGNKWPGGSIAESVIEPVLKTNGVRKIDAFVLSHSDSDHAGGRDYIEKVFSPTFRYSSQHISGYSPCIAGENWQWNGLKFEVFWPPRLVKRAYNPHSCVIRVSDDYSSLLLTGDVELIAELLLAQKKHHIASDIMLVPHHGSATSSSAYLIDAVKPNVAIASVAKGNQWNLPNPDVVKRYQENGTVWLSTGESGQITIELDELGWTINTHRSRQYLTWYRQTLRKGVE
jgi:competence protein ComEC